VFEKILIPLPSEYFPEHAVNRGIQIASKYNSKLIFDFIFEKKVIEKINNVSSGAVSQCALENMTEEVKNVEESQESSVFFDRIDELVKSKGIETRKLIHTGFHTDEILDCIKEHDVDLIITEFHKDTLLKYRIFYNSPIPVWLEQSGLKLREINGVLSNLSPNKRVPKFTYSLAKKMDLPLKYYYVIDKSEPYDEDSEQTERENLINNIEKMGKASGLDVDFELVTEDVSVFLDNTFKEKENMLVILGRFEKPTWLPFSNLDKKIEVSKKLNANVLMLN
jgi:hypothetical protein